MIYLFSVSILWAFSFSLIKGELNGIDPGFVAFFRLLLSFLVFAPFLPALWLGQRSGFSAALFIGMIQFGVMYILYINSFRWLTAWQVALFTVSTPLYVSVFFDWYRRQVNLRNLLAAFMAVAGTAGIIYQADKSYTFTSGFLLIQGANMAFAAGQVAYKLLREKKQDMGDAAYMAAAYLGAVLLTFFYTLFWGVFPMGGVSTGQWLTLIYLGVVASGVGFFLWNKGATRVNAGTLAVFNNLKIPLAILVALIIFGEQADIIRLGAGSLLLLLALWLAERKTFNPGKLYGKK
ncbi:MAG TPA: EamA family transporter [Caldithrix abyssi]|uniref:EamA family transporter n=1 Tax=Caldithrix abyssi TaxID=187145 RepID=A0A7V1LNE2_CALAY|nr:EamA family transporter [Caldithrix abyssi]